MQLERQQGLIVARLDEDEWARWRAGEHGLAGALRDQLVPQIARGDVVVELTAPDGTVLDEFGTPAARARRSRAVATERGKAAQAALKAQAHADE